jgi:drug/metabolite transporter (DMT)-like permease
LRHDVGRSFVFKNRSPHSRAVLQALFVTFLWSTSWVFIKIGLQDEIPALTFAGLRYTLAFLFLLLIAIRRSTLVIPLRNLSRREWTLLVLLGFMYYTVNQGAQFIGLAALPAATVNLLLSLTAIVVSLLGVYLLAERPTTFQWGGVALYAIGVVVYFYPVSLPADQLLAVLIVIIGVAANAGATLLGRSINRQGHLHPLTVTVVSMGVGSLVLLVVGIATQGLPPLTPVNWLIVVWLALVNTAFAFTLWNHTLRTLSAMESSIINNAMLIQIPILAWLFLGETFTWKQAIALVLAGVGILAVQMRSLNWTRIERRRQQT